MSALGTNGLRLAALAALALFLHACAAPPKMRIFGPGPGPAADRPEKRVEQQAVVPPKSDQVIGRLAVVRTREGDTLPDVARHFGLGHDAVRAANPDVDVWAPPAGSRVVLPLMFILPDTPRQGLVINLAAMRLFHHRGKGRATVTHPVGIGEEGRSTPMGEMHVERKAVRPTWYVPASIRKDHAKRGDPLPAEVPPGPDNPLGEYALYLSRTSYVIHGTNKPYSIGLRATNGCLRLYPEDVEKLYPFVPVCRGATFFRIQACKGEELVDAWPLSAAPAGVKVTLAFAESYETVRGTRDVPDEAKISRTLVINAMRKVKFALDSAEDANQPDANEPAAKEPATETQETLRQKSPTPGPTQTTRTPAVRRSVNNGRTSTPTKRK